MVMKFSAGRYWAVNALNLEKVGRVITGADVYYRDAHSLICHKNGRHQFKGLRSAPIHIVTQTIQEWLQLIFSMSSGQSSKKSTTHDSLET
jgi:hypothetical protein